MSHMLQKFLLCFQAFPLAPGISTRHICDMKREKTEELEVRRQLARELGSSRPLNFGFRRMLAGLIDPDGDSEQCLRFTKRRRGNAGDAGRDNKVAECVWRAGGNVKGQTEAAVIEAMKAFRLSRSSVYKIWSKWQPILKRRYRIYGPLSHENIKKYWPR